MSEFLSLKDVSVKTRGLTHINATFKKGEFVILVGPNGSGKTTLFGLIEGTIKPDSGVIKKPKKIMVIKQDAKENLFLDLTVYENFMLYCANKISKDAISSRFNLDALAGDLSGGEKQVLALELVEQNLPDLLLLDEHTSALDPKAEEITIKKTLELAERTTCVMISHNPNHNVYAKRLLFMEEIAKSSL